MPPDAPLIERLEAHASAIEQVLAWIANGGPTLPRNPSKRAIARDLREAIAALRDLLPADTKETPVVTMRWDQYLALRAQIKAGEADLREVMQRAAAQAEDIRDTLDRALGDAGKVGDV